MDKIAKQIRTARRRLTWQSGIVALPYWLLVTFAICFVGLLIPKIWVLRISFENWSQYWIGTSALVAIVGTIATAFLKRPSTERVALEIDNRFRLRERISSALLLSDAEKSSPVGQALLEDAVAKVDRIDVRDQFALQATARLPWILLPILSCVILFWIPNAQSSEETIAKNSSQERINQVKAQTKPILEQIQRMKKDAEEQGLKDLVTEYEKMRQKLEDIQKSKPTSENKLLADLNDIKKDMIERKEALGSSEKLKQAFKDLKDMEQGPASKIADAFKDGDFDAAQKELGKLLEQLSSNKLSDEQKKKLADQLKQLDKAVENAKQQQKDAIDQLKQEMERAKQAGDMNRAGQIQKQIENLEKALANAKKSDKLCEQCKKAAEALEKGDKAAAQQALEEMKGEIGQLLDDAKALEEMEEMLEDMEGAKQAKQGKAGKPKNKPGDGSGEGRGVGDRPEDETDTDTFEAQVRDQIRKGEQVFAGKVGGANRKGISREEAKESIMNAQPEDPDAIENLALPKAQRDQQREYFDSLRK